MKNCEECEHYTYIPEQRYMSNGDPGYPAEQSCKFDWCCPYCENYVYGRCSVTNTICDGECDEK